MTKKLIFDFEATGVDTGNDRIIQYSVRYVNDKLETTDEWVGLVNPEMPIPPESTEIHGITDDMVKDAPTFNDLAEKFQETFQDAVLIGQNIAHYDIPLLHNELLRAGQPGLPSQLKVIDTYKIENYVNSHKLEAMYKRYTGTDLEGAHDASADTHAVAEVLKGQMRRHGSQFDGAAWDEITLDKLDELNGNNTDKKYLDHERRFYQNGDGTIFFGFGKNRDQPIEVDPSYLNWMANKGDFSPAIKQLVNKLRILLGKYNSNYNEHVDEL